MNAGPRTEGDRYETLDITRGVALLGILTVNMIAFAGPWEAVDFPHFWGEVAQPFATWWAVRVFFEGTQRALFSMLFGAGTLLLLERLEARKVVEGSLSLGKIYYRRIGLLFGFGMINAYLLLWPGDILVCYAIVGVILFPMRRFSTKTLIGLAIAIMIYNIGTMGLYYDEAVADSKMHAALIERQEAGEILSEDDLEIIADYEDEHGVPQIDDEEIRERTEAFLGSYSDTLVAIAPESFYVQTTEFTEFYFPDTLMMMLIGMVLYRLGVLTFAVSTRFVVWMTLIGYGLGIPLKIWQVRFITAADWVPPDAYLTYFGYDQSRLLIALGHLGATLLFSRGSFGAWLKHALVAVGRLALTNYLGQSVICALIFTGTGLGLYGQLRGYQVYYALALVWMIQLIASPIWLKHFRFGPVEWLWRSLTYGRRMPLLR